LGGKNVIDILLLVRDRDTVLKTVKKLVSLRYGLDRDEGSGSRIFLTLYPPKGGRQVPKHLHLMWKASKEYRDHLLFRDYLRGHPEEAKRYYLLKRSLAERAGFSRRRYTKMKARYIRGVLGKARRAMSSEEKRKKKEEIIQSR